jgi:hypothetical protein
VEGLSKIERWIVERSGGKVSNGKIINKPTTAAYRRLKPRLMLYHDLLASDTFKGLGEKDRQDRAALVLNYIYRFDTQKDLAGFLEVTPKKLQRWAKQDWFRRLEPQIVEMRRRDFVSLALIAREKLREQLEQSGGKVLNEAIRIALSEARKEEELLDRLAESGDTAGDKLAGLSDEELDSEIERLGGK